MSTNSILELPEEVFTNLRLLTWLDLRDNLLSRIPSTIKMASNLKTLLLDDNRIRFLPFELGLLDKLKALHLRNNPIEFPPDKVLNQGAKCMMKYLKDCYRTREGGSKSKDRKQSEQIILGDVNNSAQIDAHQRIECSKPILPIGTAKDSLGEASSSVDSAITHMGLNEGSSGIRSTESYSPSFTLRRASSADCLSHTQNEDIDERAAHSDDEVQEALEISRFLESFSLTENDSNSLDEPSSSAHTCENRMPPWIREKSMLYRKIEQSYLKNRRNGPTSQRLTKMSKLQTQSARHATLLPDDPPQPSMERIRRLHSQEMKRKTRQIEMIQQQRVIQRIKDSGGLDCWKDDYKKKKRDKEQEYMGKSRSDIIKEADERITLGPVEVNPLDLRMLDSSELNAIRYRSIKSAPRPPNLDPYVVLQLELASSTRDQRLTQRVNRHMAEVVERFQLPLPCNRETLREDMLQAKRDLDLAIRLHRQVKQRMETLEHFRGSNRRDLW